MTTATGAVPPDLTRRLFLSRYLVALTFSNGEERVIDLEPLLWGPMFEPLLADYNLFLQGEVSQEAGTLLWPNGADIAPETLYARPRTADKWGYRL